MKFTLLSSLRSKIISGNLASTVVATAMVTGSAILAPEILDNWKYVILFVVSPSIVVGTGLAFWTSKYFAKPIQRINNFLDQLSSGAVPEQIKSEQDDELGEIQNKLDILASNISNVVSFADEIRNNNLNAEFSALGEHDKLGHSLLSMRASLKDVELTSERRSWINNGVALFSDLLREDYDDMKSFGKALISELVRYLGANQGAIFIIDGVDSTKMNQVATYAYNREKHLSGSVEFGEGLIGECWREKKKIYMTDVPENYINITSGLGTTNPRCIIVQPLISNDKVVGIMEMASFKTLEEHEQEFIDRLCEGVATTIANTRNAEKTSKLLKESQEKSERLQTQEEEMRQNAEEMQATQEQVSRKLEDTENNLKEEKEHIQAIVQTASDAIILIEENGLLRNFNERAQYLFQFNDSMKNSVNIKKVLAIESVPSFLSKHQEEFYETQLDVEGTAIDIQLKVNRVEVQKHVTYTLFVSDVSQVKQQTRKAEEQLKTVMAEVKKLRSKK